MSQDHSEDLVITCGARGGRNLGHSQALLGNLPSAAQLYRLREILLHVPDRSTAPHDDIVSDKIVVPSSVPFNVLFDLPLQAADPLDKPVDGLLLQVDLCLHPAHPRRVVLHELCQLRSHSLDLVLSDTCFGHHFKDRFQERLCCQSHFHFFKFSSVRV